MCTVKKNKAQQIIPKNNVSPSKRQQCTLNYYKNKLYLFGGSVVGCFFNDLWEFCLKTNKWKQLQSFKKTNGHTTVIFEDKLITFGGYNRIKGKWIGYNDLMMYHIISNKWEVIKTKDTILARGGHCMLLDDNQLIIHGGWNEKGGYQILGDSFCIDLLNVLKKKSIEKWKSKNINISKFENHQILQTNNKYVLFGGYNDDKMYTNDFITVDKDTNAIQKYDVTKISKRSGHQMTFIEGGKILVFGGSGGNGKYFNDFYVIDIGLGLNTIYNNIHKIDENIIKVCLYFMFIFLIYS